MQLLFGKAACTIAACAFGQDEPIFRYSSWRILALSITLPNMGKDLGMDCFWSLSDVAGFVSLALEDFTPILFIFHENESSSYTYNLASCPGYRISILHPVKSVWTSCILAFDSSVLSSNYSNPSRCRMSTDPFIELSLGTGPLFAGTPWPRPVTPHDASLLSDLAEHSFNDWNAIFLFTIVMLGTAHGEVILHQRNDGSRYSSTAQNEQKLFTWDDERSG